jgi:hypothetical protein
MFIVALFKVTKLWNPPKNPSMDKENMAYIHNGTLFSCKEG